MSRRLRAAVIRWLCVAIGAQSLVVGTAHALQDPTRPPGPQAAVAKSVPERSLALDSILFSKDRRVAVIEGEALREGQGFNSVRVIRIFADRVLVTDNGRERVLYLERLPQVRGTQ